MVLCVVLALRISSCRLRSSLNSERWVSWDRSSTQQTLPKMVDFSNLVNLFVNTFSSAATSSFPWSASCTACRISWSLSSGWKLSFSSAGLSSSSTSKGLRRGSWLILFSRSCYRDLSLLSQYRCLHPCRLFPHLTWKPWHYLQRSQCSWSRSWSCRPKYMFR